MEVSVNVGQTVINLYTVQGRDIVTYLWPDTFYHIVHIRCYKCNSLVISFISFKIQPCFSVQW